MQGEVLVCHGSKDSFVTAEMMSEFETDVKERSGNVSIHTYSDAMHAFTRPEKTLEGYVRADPFPPFPLSHHLLLNGMHARYFLHLGTPFFEEECVRQHPPPFRPAHTQHATNSKVPVEIPARLCDLEQSHLISPRYFTPRHHSWR